MDTIDSKISFLVNEMECETTEQMLAVACSDSVVLGICINSECEFTVNVEPDCSDGYCEFCETNTVKSPLVIFGLI